MEKFTDGQSLISNISKFINVSTKVIFLKFLYGCFYQFATYFQETLVQKMEFMPH